LAQNTSVPIHFVLGNHDYHRRSIASVHNGVSDIVGKHSNLIWATQSITTLAPGVALLGTEGWCDATVGYRWWMRMTFDHFLIKDYATLGFSKWIKLFHEKALREAEALEKRLLQALVNHDHVYVLTHFPPWDDAILHGVLKRFWTAYDVNHSLGDAIDRVMSAHPTKRCTVLSGHTHVPVTCFHDNIVCHVGYSRSHRPVLSEKLLAVEDSLQSSPVTVGAGVLLAQSLELNTGL
jgi:predicted phosphohydrolase